MNNTELKVSWTNLTDDYERRISGTDTLQKLLTDIEMHLSIPAMVEFYTHDSQPALSVGFGRDLTVVTYEHSVDPPYYISLGEHPGDGGIEFCHGNELIEYSLTNAVPFADGLQALKLFLESGDLPNNLRWGKL
jgi:hypothetical protein